MNCGPSQGFSPRRTRLATARLPTSPRGWWMIVPMDSQIMKIVAVVLIVCLIGGTFILLF